MHRRRLIFDAAITAAAAFASLTALGCVRNEGSRTATPSNIILITIDTLRADRVTAAITPTLHQLKVKGVEFTQAVTTAPLTAPAHASLFTGLNPPRHGVRDNAVFSLPPGVPTYVERLQRSGYATGAFVSALVLDSRYGLDRGFDVYDDDVRGVERAAGETLDRAQQWIATATKPFFVWIHLFEPHAPYVAGSYDAEVSAVDRALQPFVTTLGERALWNDAVVSVTSDHGESLGDHGEATHGFFLYDAVLRIPWLVRAPGLSPATYAQQVRIVDVMPTLLRLAGVGEDTNAGLRIDGVDLSAAMRGATPEPLEAYSETWLPRHQFGWSELTSLRRSGSKFIEAPLPELYDLASDPHESSNIAGNQHQQVSAARRTLAAIASMAAAEDGRRTVTDPALAERFMSLGYIGSSPAAPPGSTLADPKDKIELYTMTMEALELSERGDKRGALAALDRAIARDPNIAQVHFVRGSILGDLGRYAEAAAALERTVALNPRYVTARFKLALAYLRLTKHADAERALESVLRDEPENVRAWHNLATVAYARGDLRRAEELELKAVSLDRNYGEAWNALGAVYIVTKRPAPALEALKTAAALTPTSGQVQANLALAHQALGQSAEAAAARDRACHLDRRYCAR